MVIVEKLVEWRLAKETEVLGENLPQRHFVHKDHTEAISLRPKMKCTLQISMWTATPSAIQIKFSYLGEEVCN
jgi:hypothetical protein